jgi:hypothetical protein
MQKRKGEYARRDCRHFLDIEPNGARSFVDIYPVSPRRDADPVTGPVAGSVDRGTELSEGAIEKEN